MVLRDFIVYRWLIADSAMATDVSFKLHTFPPGKYFIEIVEIVNYVSFLLNKNLRVLVLFIYQQNLNNL